MSRVVRAPAARVYAILADYREGHPRILPPRYFGSLEVLAGGVGAGTEIRFHMRALGTRRTLRAVITEPDPGHILLETDPESGTVTTFTVEPDAPSQQASVTIATGLPVRPGLRGILERWLAARFLRRVYADELQRLASVAETGD
jgi:Polyketide cyclase / dehydrase and lipid transport